jgi:putative salt-induced outer membrane protein YdiY
MQKWLFLGFLFVVLSQSTPSEAQIVNMQAALSGDIPDGAGLSAEFRQEKKSGNTETERLSGQGTLTYKRPEDLWLLVLRREYSTESGQSSADSQFQHLRYRYKITENWGWEGFLQQDADRFRRSARRNVIGTGPRYQASPIENMDLALSTGYLHEREEFSQEEGELLEAKRETERLANALYLSWKWPDCCTLANTLYYQPEIGKIKNHRTLNETSLLIQINRNLSYRISQVYSFNAKPPSGVKKADVSFLQALVVKI